MLPVVLAGCGGGGTKSAAAQVKPRPVAQGWELHTLDDVDILTIDDTLDGGDVLPSFTLPVKDIFPE